MDNFNKYFEDLKRAKNPRQWILQNMDNVILDICEAKNYLIDRALEKELLLRRNRQHTSSALISLEKDLLDLRIKIDKIRITVEVIPSNSGKQYTAMLTQQINLCSEALELLDKRDLYQLKLRVY